MKTTVLIAVVFLVCYIEAFPEGLRSNSEEANEFIRSKRWARSNGRCFTKKFCKDYAEFVEDAENKYGRDLLREEGNGLQ